MSSHIKHDTTFVCLFWDGGILGPAQHVFDMALIQCRALCISLIAACGWLFFSAEIEHDDLANLHCGLLGFACQPPLQWAD